MSEILSLTTKQVMEISAESLAEFENQSLVNDRETEVPPSSCPLVDRVIEISTEVA